MKRTAPIALALTASIALLASCSAGPTPANEFIAGTWDCTWVRVIDPNNGGSPEGMVYRIVLGEEGSGTSQERYPGSEPGRVFDLEYSLSGSALEVTSTEFGRVSISGVPEEIASEAAPEISLSGDVVPPSSFSTTVSEGTVSGIVWGNGELTCAPVG